MAYNKISIVLSCFLVFTVPSLRATAQQKSGSGSAETAIITAMKNSEDDWNKGDLTTGPAGLSAIRDLYEKHYFNGKTPKQNLHYDELKVTMLIHTTTGWKILHDHSS